MSESVKISRYLVISAIILVGGLILGFIISKSDPSFGERLLVLFEEMVGNDIIDDEPWMMAVQLFLNNLEACAIIFIGGALLGIVPVLILGLNGLIIGGILEVVRKDAGDIAVLASIIPHGIFEIPAVITSGALGLMLGDAVWQDLSGNGFASGEATRLGGIFIRYIIPFVAIAACIEAFITPAVLQLVT
ncbi:MAG: stage II sporulation protein M [Methanospirillum sp.]|nr:stage II sporulation protein M [Methanospirillum sp.]